MLLQHYHEFCNTNEPSSMFVSPPPITNIESLSQSTISSLYSGSFGRNRYDMNIQQQTTSEVADTETVLNNNEEIDPPPSQDILSVFSAAEFSFSSSSDSADYKRAWLKAKVIRSYILSPGEFSDACSRALYIEPNHREIAFIMTVNGTILPKQMPMQLHGINKRKKYFPM